MYDPRKVQAFFDDYGTREVDRFEQGLVSRINYDLHRRLLARFVHAGDRVLDVGAGPGRFTIELARLGAWIAASDISPVQLDLHRRQVQLAGCEDAVLSRTLDDIVDLSRFREGEFDVALAFGGPLSYVFERRDEALSELLRVVRPGGRIVASVMSLIGTTSLFLSGVLNFAQTEPQAVARINETGDLAGDLPGTHPCHMYRWSELSDWLTKFPCRVLGASASGVLARGATPDDAVLLQPESARFLELVDWDEQFSQEPGALDLGTHILFALERA